ncbi:glycosyltransferase [Micromonospora sp. WMMD998]|uniref:glycosyltransferase n=1 Tax=Micromonospora sp. WMMD998 TaxID=3016092 RepID=UPI00249B66CF|nr:glycosyltransferase [Micromonospora sp. WMMD998]WFE41132.1 glycosyltransferase [Micromonospora sp. WMMD998]
MARILVATTPGDGHVNGMIQAARALVEDGHDVHWYTGRAFAPKVERIGAVFEPMQRAYDWGGKSREEAFPSHTGLTGLGSMVAAFRDIFIGAAYEQMLDLLALLERFPADVVVTGETMYGAGFAAEHRGLPTAWVATSIYVFSSRDTAPLGLALPPSTTPVGRLRNSALRRATRSLVPALRDVRQRADAARRRAGLTPIDRGPFENIVPHPALYLMGTVPSFEYPRTDLLPQTRFVGPFTNPPPTEFDAPRWWPEIEEGRPVVHVTQGTVAHDAQRLLRPTMDAMADDDVLVVVTTGRQQAIADLGPVPSNVRVESFIPHSALLPHVDAMVTNGGYGGVNTALSYGVPLVVVPASEEKHEVAARVAWSGVGVAVRRRMPSPSHLRTAIRTVLRDPSFRARATDLRNEYERHDAPRRAAELIAQLAGQPGHIGS